MAEVWARADAGPDLSGAESDGRSFRLVFIISLFYEGYLGNVQSGTGGVKCKI
jgi:hypothetical protein